MTETLQCLKKHGQRLDLEIAKEMRVPLATVRQHLTALAERREAIVCKTIQFEKGRQFRIGRESQRDNLLDGQLLEQALLIRRQDPRAPHAHLESDDPVLQLGRIGAADQQQRQDRTAERKQTHRKGRPAAHIEPPHREGRERHDEEETSDRGGCRPVRMVGVGLCCHTGSIRPRSPVVAVIRHPGRWARPGFDDVERWAVWHLRVVSKPSGANDVRSPSGYTRARPGAPAGPC